MDYNDVINGTGQHPCLVKRAFYKMGGGGAPKSPKPIPLRQHIDQEMSATRQSLNERLRRARGRESTIKSNPYGLFSGQQGGLKQTLG